MKTIKIMRIFGKLLPQRNESLVKELAKSFKSCYFEKDINNGCWYLTVKNIPQFDLTYYYNKVRSHRGYLSTIVSFSDDQHSIQSEFSSKKVSKEEESFQGFPSKLLKNGVKYKINNRNNSLRYILGELIEYIDGTFVIKFFKKRVEYKFEKKERNYNICVSNFGETLNLDAFIFMLNKWKQLNADNYSGLFKKSYSLYKRNDQIVVNFTRKINPVFKK